MPSIASANASNPSTVSFAMTRVTPSSSVAATYPTVVLALLIKSPGKTYTSRFVLPDSFSWDAKARVSKERRCNADRRRIGILESFVAGVNSIESIFGTFVVFGLVGGSTLLSVDAGGGVGVGDGFD